jgi:hypothetical protein
MYIDPSSGGLLFQILAIAFTTISGVILLFSNRIKMFFSRLRRTSNPEENDQQKESSPIDEK